MPSGDCFSVLVTPGSFFLEWYFGGGVGVGPEISPFLAAQSSSRSLVVSMSIGLLVCQEGFVKK